MANTAPILLDPKQKFQQSSDNISKHRDLVEDPRFQRAIETTKLQYQKFLSGGSPTQFDFMCNGIAMKAVNDFCDMLLRLSEKVAEVQRTPPNDNLRPN